MKSSENAVSSNHEISNTGKIIINQNIPIEELLGSVTAYNNVEGSDTKSLQLRTSARVFKKMKLDSANASIIIPEKKEAVKEEAKPEVKKPFRPLWTTEDKNYFFEALNEFGKDFEAIHMYISSKLKKKGLPDPVIKTKDQIRHLYYRTWHKISKHLKFSEDVKKIAQELYGLINYGEVRKKIAFISEKTCVKLNELIYRGSVAIRVKGKTIRIRTPMCRALRKLNQLDEKHDDIKLPTRVNVELHAKDMKSWLHVQEMAQNPRVKTPLPLQKRLSSLIQCLNERWKTQNAVTYEKMLHESHNHMKACLSDGTTENFEPVLRLCPLSSCNIVIPTINLSEYLTSQSICLNAYEERIGVKVPGEQIWQNMFSNFRASSKGSTRKGGTKRHRNESLCEKLMNKHVSQTQIDTNENCLHEADMPSSVNEVMDEAVNTILALQNQDMNDNFEAKNEESEIKLEDLEEMKTVKKEHDVNRIRNGWTVHDCGTLSIGDLYLMFGADSKIILEYSWDQPVECKIEDVEKLAECDMKKAQEVAPELPADANIDCDLISIESNNDLATTLKRLLSVAKLQFGKNVVKCPCGHVCNGNKSNAVKNKTVVAKPIKTNEKNHENSEVSSVNGASSMSSVVDQISVNTTMGMPIFQSQVSKLSSTLFRRPISPNDGLMAQLDSIQRLKPKYCNRRGRPRAKQVVVERKLPLLANKADSGRQIVQMNIVAQDNMPPHRAIAPKLVEINTDLSTPGNVNQTLVNTEYVNGNITVNEVQTFNIISVDQTADTTAKEGTLITDNATTPSRVGSPTDMANFIELTRTSHDNDRMLLGSLPQNNIENAPSFAGILSDTGQTTTPPTSPSRILKENENQWYHSEVADYSLSSLLGHLDSPAKHPQNVPSISGEDSRLCLPQDVDAQLHSLLTENSLDYMATFADLAAQVNTEAKK